MHEEEKWYLENEKEEVFESQVLEKPQIVLIMDVASVTVTQWFVDCRFEVVSTRETRKICRTTFLMIILTQMI